MFWFVICVAMMCFAVGAFVGASLVASITMNRRQKRLPPALARAANLPTPMRAS